ncbi:MAG: inositol monophosphatase family protein [Acidimicrobiales bacterium]
MLDPIDGSTNASLALPWFATSICVVDRGAPVAAVVHDHASGARFAATRGGGATRDGSPLARREPVGLSDAIIAVNGVPGGHGGWAQFRCFGAAALDLCAVAEGRFDGYIDFADDGHGPWDYLGGLLVCREVGVEVLDARDRELVVLDPEVRRAPVAGPTGLVEELVGVRAALTPGDRS